MDTTVRLVGKGHNNRFVRVFLFAVFMAFASILPGCEDDPLLEPSEVDNGGGGSYGKMRLANDGTYEVDSLYEANPEEY